MTLTLDWTNTSAIGYPTLFSGVLIGSIIPVVPTGAVVSAAAAVAMTTSHLSLPLVLVLSVVGGLIGDLVTFAIARLGGGVAVRWLARGQRPDRLESYRERFETRGRLLLVIGRLVPAGRIPVLLAAGAVAYQWRKLLPVQVLACVLWAVEYVLLGALSGGIFDNPLTATILATVLVLVVTGMVNVIARVRRARKEARAPRSRGLSR